MASGSEQYTGVNRGRSARGSGARRRRSTVSQFDPNGAPF